MFKVRNKNTRLVTSLCSRLAIKLLVARSTWIFLFLVSLFLTLNTFTYETIIFTTEHVFVRWVFT